MTLAQVYPYWILGDVPDSDIPFIACSDMLEGNLADEIVAVAALTQHDLAEIRELLPRAFARLGLPPMSETDAAKLVAMEKMRAIAEHIILRQHDSLGGANALYGCARDAGLGSDDDIDPHVAEYGREFLQLSDALELVQGIPGRKQQAEEIIIEAAEALLAGKPIPDWHMDRNGFLHRGPPPREVSRQTPG
jgi:hypothetical protein